ncbi:ATP-binding protein [Streptacidiphilus sp. EB103A]|uniref:ATP-binding protein n=1 Tax=Streptacidiphilus sp. EB103A TaxID=3156275 RepID=UPI00351564BD
MTSGFGARWFMASTPATVAAARHGTVAQLRTWGFQFDEEVASTFALLVSELVTNAILHGSGDFLTIAMCARSEEVYVEVLDGSSVTPALREAEPDDESGRGMFLVNAYAASWGVHSTPRGKAVWATCRLPAQPVPTRQRCRAEVIGALIRKARPRIYVGALRAA